MKGKQYNYRGTDLEVVTIMLNNLEEFITHYENNKPEDKEILEKLKFTKEFITFFEKQL